MNEEPSRIVLKKNEDGTTRKVVIKRVKRKVRIKTKTPGEKPAETEINKTGSEKVSDNATAGKTSSANPPQKQTPDKPKEPTQKSSPNEKETGKKKKIIINKRKEADTGESSELKKHHSPKPKYPDTSKHKDKFQEGEDKLNKIHVKKKDDDFTANVPAQIEIPEVISIKNLAQKLNLKAVQVIKKFFSLGVMDLTVNDSIDADSATILCNELNCDVHVVSLSEMAKIEPDKGNEKDYIKRGPVVTVMGHVDHGKTTLLDAIRKTKVVDTESGGITQHISAYKVQKKNQDILFIDTPGHAAFSAMRSRGAKVTDIIILIVAATDGVMPQTIEVINHAKASKCPIIVAVNKIDMDNADPKKVRTQLAEHNLVSEEWGGDIIFQDISALNNKGIDELLEAVLLQAEMMDIKANPKVRASGYVIESRIEKGRGNVITVAIQNGTLKKSDAYIVGNFPGRVRALFDENGNEIKEAPPSTPVEIIGVSGTPIAGDAFVVVKSEKEAKQISQHRVQLMKEYDAQNIKKVTLNNLFDTMKAQKVKELKVILKGDVFGSVEAIKEALTKQENDEVKVSVIHSATGAINESDVSIAGATENAVIIGFKVRPNAKARKLAEQEKVEIKTYNIIYEILDDITDSLENMMEHKTKEEKIGQAEIQKVFKITGAGKIAGCLVKEGKISNHSYMRLFRDNVLIHEGKIASLRRYKDEVKEVNMGTECGIQIEGFQDIKPQDTVEAYIVHKLEKKFESSS